MMYKKVILVASPPACGKTYVSEMIANSLAHIVYLDKDDLGDLIRAAFHVSGNELDMDGEFYTNNLRVAEYSTILKIAFSALRFADCVLVNAPFGKEVRCAEYMRMLKDAANKNGARLILIWVTASVESCYGRMKKRNSERDTLKLANWKNYVKKINFNPPYELENEGAVDCFIIFDNDDNASFAPSLKKTIEIITGE